MISFSVEATRPALPVQFAGMRAEKSPRLTAVRTLSVTRGSMTSGSRTRRAIEAPSLAGMIQIASELRSNPFGDPETDPRPGAGLAVVSAPSARELGSLAHRHQAEVTR